MKLKGITKIAMLSLGFISCHHAQPTHYQDYEIAYVDNDYVHQCKIKNQPEIPYNLTPLDYILNGDQKTRYEKFIQKFDEQIKENTEGYETKKGASLINLLDSMLKEEGIEYSPTGHIKNMFSENSTIDEKGYFIISESISRRFNIPIKTGKFNNELYFLWLGEKDSIEYKKLISATY